MGSDLIHIVIIDEGPEYGFSVSSPQIPGFTLGRLTLDEVRADLDGALEFAGVDLGIDRAYHFQHLVELPDGRQVELRVSDDEMATERHETVKQMLSVLQTDQREELLAKAVTAPADRTVFVMAQPTDLLGWLEDQVDERTGAVNLTAPVAGAMIWVRAMARGVPVPGMLTLDQLGLTRDSTVSELMMTEHRPRGAKLVLPQPALAI